jgi:hypothetical protein
VFKLSEQFLVAKSAVKSRHHVLFYFGICHDLKVTYERRAMLCPHCNMELLDGEYSGSKVFALDRHSRDYKRDVWLPEFEDGVKVWNVAPKRDRKPCWVLTEKKEVSYD